MLPGTIIENIANIYFDFNPPVITEPSVLVAEFSTGVEELQDDLLVVYPVPTAGRVTVHSLRAVIQRIQIIAADGRVELTQDCRSNSEIVDMTGLSSGLYILRVQFDDNTISYRTVSKTTTQ